MPRRNRVTPFGALIATPARGAFFGNRGCLHDDHGALRRNWTTRAWICCALSFKDRRRDPLMQPGKYTELFFLDEATAFAAGHRPCAECRRADFNRFRAHWGRAAGLAAPPRAPDMDARLHAERVDPATGRRLHPLPDDLPDGVFVARAGDAFLVAGNRLHRWSPDGYAEAGPLVRDGLALLTPPSIAAVFADGYRPHMRI